MLNYSLTVNSGDSSFYILVWLPFMDKISIWQFCAVYQLFLVSSENLEVCVVSL